MNLIIADTSVQSGNILRLYNWSCGVQWATNKYSIVACILYLLVLRQSGNPLKAQCKKQGQNNQIGTMKCSLSRKVLYQ